MKRIISVFLTITLTSALACNTFAARTAQDVKKEQAKTQQNLDAAEEEAADIASEQAEAKEEMAESEEKLAQIITSVSIIEDEIKAKTDAVEKAKKDYEKAKKREEKQYAAMKRRIRYMYEHGGSGSPYAEFFSGSTDFADILNRSAYAEEIYEYDRNLLIEYQETRKQVKETEIQLQNELDELNEIKTTYEEESNELQRIINEQRSKVENFGAQLASARAKAAKYKEEIASQNREIRQIAEAEAAAAAAKKKAEEEARAKKKKAEEEARKKAAEEAAAAGKSEEKKKKEESQQESEEDEFEYAPEEEGEYEEEEEEEKPRQHSSGGGGSAKGNEIAAYAQNFLGNPYVLGGTSLTDGVDCSGFTQAVYSHFGISIPRTSWEQQSAGHSVSYSEAQPGDIVCYSGHVGIYIGNNTICHASTPETGIKLTPATYRDIVTIRRIV